MKPEIWSTVAVFSFWSWVASFLVFLFRAFPTFGIFQSRQALIWAGTSFVCACLWVVALRQA